MPFLLLDFPAFDPVIVSIGPFAIRWYALAYIFGILLGWLYARALIRTDALCGGGKAPMTVSRFRRLHRLGHARHHPRRAHRLCAVLQPGLFRSRIRAKSCSSGRAACRSTAASPAACSRWCCSPGSAALPILSLGDLTCAGGADRIVPRTARQFHQWRIVGPADGCALGHRVSRRGGPLPRHPSQLYEAALEGLVLFVVLAIAVRAGALKRPGLIIGLFAMGYAMARAFLRILPRARSAAWLSVRRPYHGHAAVGAAVPRRPWLCSLTRCSTGRCPADAERGRSLSARDSKSAG